MANIALQTRVSAKTRPELDTVDETFPVQKLTLPASEAITCGAPVRIVPSSTGAGRWANGNATDTTENDVYGIATRTVVAGETVTAYRKGRLDGFDIAALDYGAILFLSDTDARIADAAGTTVVPIGRVIPGTAVTTGTAYDRILEVDFDMASGGGAGGLFSAMTTALLLADQIDQTFFVATRRCMVLAASEVHAVAEAGGTLNIQLVRQQGVEAPASGDALLTNNTNAGWNGLGTAQTVQVGALIATAATKTLEVGDRLGLDFTGDVAGELLGTCVTVTLLPL